MSFSASVTELVQNSPSPLVDAAPSWVRVDLGDVAAILNGYPWKSAYFNDQLGEPVIRIRDVTSGTTETKYRGEVVHGYWVEDGDLLVGMDGDFNVRVWDGGRALLNQRVCRITPDKRLYLPELLAHVLPGYLQLIHDETHSITVKHLSSKTLAEIPLPLPPLPEQRRIVAKIDSLTGKSRRARDHLDHIPRLVEKYKQAVLAAAFRGDLTREWSEEGRLALNNHGMDGRLTNLSILPAGWSWTSMGAVAQITGGLTKNAARNALPLHVPYLRVANVYANELRLDEITEIGCTEAEYQRTLLQPGDLLIVEGNGSLDQIGRVALWDGEHPGCAHQNHLIRARMGDDLIPPYTLYWLLSPQGRNAIETVASSSSGLHTLSISKVRGLPVPICSKEQQEAIVRRIRSAFIWIDRLASEATSARRLIDRLDQSVLAKAFRGELVPQDPEEEPASVLLERIRAERGAAPKAKRGRKGMPSGAPSIVKTG